MPISGVVIRCKQGKQQQVAEQANLLPGIEVQATLEDGQIIAVIEAASVQAEVDIASQVEQLDGVIGVQVAYHNFEDLTREGGPDGTDKA